MRGLPFSMGLGEVLLEACDSSHPSSLGGLLNTLSLEFHDPVRREFLVHRVKGDAKTVGALRLVQQLDAWRLRPSQEGLGELKATLDATRRHLQTELKLQSSHESTDKSNDIPLQGGVSSSS